MNPYTSLSNDLISTIEAALTPDCILSAPSALADYCGDASKLQHMPELVVRARNTADIQKLMQLANQYNFPVTPRGGGSGLTGACLPHLGGVVLSTADLDSVKKVDNRNFIMEVEAGTISQKVRETAAEHGLYYPPDPAGMDLSTIGGNAATDAGGPACVKYGTTRDYILGLEAVLPDGRLIHTGVKTRKGVVGYDLTNLLIGSEGTLGIITSLILKLLPKPPAVTGLMCVFENMVSAMNGVSRIMGEGHLPCAIEFLDHRCLSLVGEMLPFALPGPNASLLIIEIDGPAEQITREIEIIKTLAEHEGATHSIFAEEKEQREKIWDVRRQVSLRVRDYANVYMPEDIAVPLTGIAELIEALPGYEKRYKVEIFAFGHAGDGNIHLNVTSQHETDKEQCEKAVRDLMQLSLNLHGTISGEHGIGLAKKQYLTMELSTDSIAMQTGIKQLFDPNNILNPGKIFP